MRLRVSSAACWIPDAGAQLIRSWLEQHNTLDIDHIERCARHLHQAKGEHAAALDLLRWVELKELRVQQGLPSRWRSFYFRVLRAAAEERATTMKRGGAFQTGGLDLSTPALHQFELYPSKLTVFKHYRSSLTGLVGRTSADFY